MSSGSKCPKGGGVGLGRVTGATFGSKIRHRRKLKKYVRPTIAIEKISGSDQKEFLDDRNKNF